MCSTPVQSSKGDLPSPLQSQLLDSLECAICLSTCIRPCSTSCGHTFCRKCLRKSLAVDPQRRCPSCRHDLRATDLVVNVALWQVIQTLFPQIAANAPDTPLAEQQQNPSGRSRPAVSNRSRLRSFVPPRPIAARATAPPTATTAATTSSTAAQEEHTIDQLTEALSGLEVIDLTQENPDNELENRESTTVSVNRQRVLPRPASQRQQPRPVLAQSNWNTAPVEASLPAVRPKRVVSGLFYRSAPSRQQ